MSARTPGRRAYEAFKAWRAERNPMMLVADWTHPAVDANREGWEAAAQAVLDDAFPGLRAQLSEARARLAKVQAVTEGIALSAQLTEPSKKSQTEAKIARELLAALQETTEGES